MLDISLRIFLTRR